MISQLSAKYQFCAIHTVDTTDGSHDSGPFVHRIRESPLFVPAPFHIYNDSCLQTIEMGWLSKFESAHGLMECVNG